ncbi:MAG TPA: hypothetical protein ENG92_00930 [Thiolapillus brandeum]|uniref:Uncharacterized protein n=1 Tax=Thiolapillus brandeum TaxID=1076588 RepID=A0A831NT39_9GAMM|nr:hypothetical protein [Thiolapillus brandeum]
MSGKRITQSQENIYMKNRQTGCNQEISAAKAGRSGRRIEKGDKKPPQARTWRTHKDPFAAVWASELAPLLEKEPSLTSVSSTS